MDCAPTTFRVAWQDALYGAAGFYTRESPASHFRTSVHASALFARAVADLAAERGCATVVDIGAGNGQLLRGIRTYAPQLSLIGVDLRGRPDELDHDIGWHTVLPHHLSGLVVANEVLDNIACTVAEVDGGGRLREVRTGEPLTGDELAWSERWWPAEEPGERVEMGLARDYWWADVVGRLTDGVAVAIDYGHLRGDRPPFGTLASYRDGVNVDLTLDGSADVTAHVAVDSVAEAVGGTVVRQREVLQTLGVDGSRPPLELATSDPTAYVRALAAAGEAGELTARGGLGDFWWVLATPSPAVPSH